jgi:hypothetical protein
MTASSCVSCMPIDFSASAGCGPQAGAERRVALHRLEELRQQEAVFASANV